MRNEELSVMNNTRFQGNSENITQIEKKKFIEYIRLYPEIYLKRRFDIPYWHSGMRKMIKACQQAIKERKPLVIPSGHAQSKDYLFGRMPLWFLEAYGPSICIMTGPTDRQVSHIMWAELSNAYNTRRDKQDGFGELLKTMFRIDENWYILPFTTKDTKEAIGKFQGFHSPRMMVIFSEAQAIADEVYDQVESCLTGEIALWVILGNPLRSSGRFASMIRDKKNNVVIHLNVMDSPNYTERKNIIPGMATYEWVEDKRRKWGEKDPRWYARVLGLIPPVGIRSVFTESEYAVSQKRHLRPRELIRIVTCDVATSGKDDAQIYGMENGRIIASRTISGSTDLRIVAQEMLVIRNEIEANLYIFDGNGVGDGLGEILRIIDHDKSVKIIKSKGSEKAIDPLQYQNKRAEDHFFARDQMRKGLVQMPPDDHGGDNDSLKEELLSIEYFVNSRGRVQIEDRDDLIEKLGRSPNKASAWIMGVRALSLAKPINFKEIQLHKREKFRTFELEYEGVKAGQEYGNWNDETIV